MCVVVVYLYYSFCVVVYLDLLLLFTLCSFELSDYAYIDISASGRVLHTKIRDVNRCIHTMYDIDSVS